MQRIDFSKRQQSPDHNCFLEPVEDIETIRYLYDKEMERLRIISDRTLASIALFAADSGFTAYNLKLHWNNLKNDLIIILISAFIMLFSFILLLSLCFPTKINHSQKTVSIAFSYLDMKKYAIQLHDMNNKKENNLFVLFMYLVFLFVFFTVLHFFY